MCGRVNVSDNEGVRALLEQLGMDTWPVREPRYNVAPTQPLDVVSLNDAVPVLLEMQWGVSMTAKGKSGRMIARRVPNARDDKLFSSRLWKPMIENNRALIPVIGFYEWQRRDGKPVQAWYMTPAGQAAMFLAGIYRWPKSADDRPEVSIVTSSANQAMSKVHDRMPVILATVNEARSWIEDGDRASIEALVQPAAENRLKFTPVSDYVNNSRNEGPRCIEAA